MPGQARARLIDWVLLGVTALTWGSMFILVKKGLAIVSTPQLMGMRFLAMFFLVLPFVPGLVRKLRVPGVLSADAKSGMLWLPFFGTLLPVFLITYAQTSVGSGSTGLVHAVGPLCALLVGVMFFNERIQRSRVVGLLFGFCGVALLILGAKSAKIEGEPWAFGLLVFSMFCYGYSTHAIKKLISGLPVMAFPVATFTVLAIPSILMFFSSGGYAVMASLVGTPAFTAVLAVVIGQAIVALISHACYTQVIIRRGAVFATSVNYLVPIVALLWGVIDGESLSGLHFLSFALVGIGLYLVNARVTAAKTKL
jgi:drug/metabolite transporter (DMT)-like permease